MDKWFLPKITDYWDSRRDALNTFVAEIMGMNSEAQVRTLSAIRAAVTEHVRALPDRILIDVLYVLADDLFKAGNQISRAGDTFDNYLAASAGTLFALARQLRTPLSKLRNARGLNTRLNILGLGLRKGVQRLWRH